MGNLWDNEHTELNCTSTTAQTEGSEDHLGGHSQRLCPCPSSFSPVLPSQKIFDLLAQFQKFCLSEKLELEYLIDYSGKKLMETAGKGPFS
jgi:hypothetical protein